jgi:hypothetical protein
MHYIVHVFTEPQGSVKDALEPFRERYDDNGEWVGEWDWWVEGGRWEGYFDGQNQVPAERARTVKTRFTSPYVYLTLDGKWRPKEEYVPEGFEEDGRRQHFRDVEGFEQGYLDYLASVPDDTVVTTVDIHS